jgi:undecaprenyl-diphosphatase
METLLAWDVAAFKGINQAHNTYLDGLMWLLSQTWTWIPAALLIAYFLFQDLAPKLHNRLKNIRYVLLLACLGISIGLSDACTAEGIKPHFKRYRPCREEANLGFEVHLVKGHCGGKYGFASSHAANFFAAATFLALFWKKKTATTLLLLAATSVAFSRVYLGVHFPSDVIVGGGLGAVIGGLGYLCWHYTSKMLGNE